MASKKIILIGSAYPLRGGLASYNERLCYELKQHNHNVTIYTFSLQYPNILFPGSSQYSNETKCLYDIDIKICINSINPFNWIKIGLQLKKLKPDILIVRYWIPFMAPCLGTILRIVKTNKHTKIICIADNIIPHERRIGDTLFTNYFIKPVDKFVVMSDKVQQDLKIHFNREAIKTNHPLYDNFGKKIAKQEAKKYLGLEHEEKIILFFGFIRDYKGLDILLKAMSTPKLINSNIKLLIAGEFYDNEKKYLDLIKKLQIEKHLIIRTHFISDSEIKYYLSCCDFVVQPYKSATQSGVTPLAYHFEKPILVTDVGGLSNMVPHKKVGLVCQPNPDDIAENILELYKIGEENFIPNIIQEKQKYSWTILMKTFLENN